MESSIGHNNSNNRVSNYLKQKPDKTEIKKTNQQLRL